MPWDVFTQDYAQNFDANKLVSLSNKVYTQWNTGVKTLRIEAPTLTAPTVITDTGSITGWTAIQNTPNIPITLTLDTTYNVAGGGALVFDIGANTDTEVYTDSIVSLDLSSQENISTLFFWVYLPIASNTDFVYLQFGSSASDYWSASVTLNQQGTSFQNGWNLISIPWSTMSVSGFPDSSKIVHVLFDIGNDLGTLPQTGVKICNLVSAPGFIFELQYYSKYMFRNPSTNQFVERVIDSSYNTYLINLDTDSYNLLFNKTAYYIAQALQGSDAQYDATFWGGDDGMGGEYGKSLKRYKGLNPSEAMLKRSTYYSLPRKGYNWSNRYLQGPIK